mmetsp:Transcript_26536/g.42531  ORF Transcript_26536/g.42531 Transcript_26536/m.42531 type:complete len:257 (+) Transcript_26536:2359-3129(+)
MRNCADTSVAPKRLAVRCVETNPGNATSSSEKPGTFMPSRVAIQKTVRCCAGYNGNNKLGISANAFGESLQLSILNVESLCRWRPVLLDKRTAPVLSSHCWLSSAFEDSDKAPLLALERAPLLVLRHGRLDGGALSPFPLSASSSTSSSAPLSPDSNPSGANASAMRASMQIRSADKPDAYCRNSKTRSTFQHSDTSIFPLTSSYGLVRSCKPRLQPLMISNFLGLAVTSGPGRCRSTSVPHTCVVGSERSLVFFA